MQIWDVVLVEKRSVLPKMGTERRRSAEGTLTGVLVARHLLGRGKGDWGFWLKKTRKAMADGEVTVSMGLFIAQDEEDESVAVHRYGFYPWI